MPAKVNKQLEELLREANARFHWDRRHKTWCLSGPANGHGLGWETDDTEAENRKAAEEAAIEYLLGCKESEQRWNEYWEAERRYQSLRVRRREEGE